MIGDNIALALESISANRLRSGLTVLGVVVAVASVIMIAALGRAAETGITTSLESLGGKMVLVYPTPERTVGGTVGRSVLTQRDGESLQRSLPGVERVAPQISGRVRLVSGNRRADTVLHGVDPVYFEMTPLTMVEGVAFGESDVTSRSVVVVLGRSVAEHLFGVESAVDRRVRVNGVAARVIGVAAIPGSGFAGDQNDFVLAPITSARQRLGLGGAGADDAVGLLLVRFSPQVELEDARRITTEFLNERLRISEDETSPISVSTTEELTRAASSIVGLLQAVLVAIASISLVVGGIGIANIMLVSVTERTGEIGLRMAVGAAPAHIRSQFLTEALILCALGGLGGLLLTAVSLFTIGALTGLHASVSLTDVGVALFVSLATGLASGFVPARRAAALDPVAALRRD